MLYWVLKYWVIGPWLRVLFRPWVEGRENVPDSGAALLASNHLSFSDSFFLAVVLNRRLTYLAKSDYFTGRGIKGFFTKLFFNGVGQVPVDRSGGRSAEAVIHTATRLLGEQVLLGIYPEGTRSPNGTLYRGRTGAARMAMEARVLRPLWWFGLLEYRRVEVPGKRFEASHFYRKTPLFDRFLSFDIKLETAAGSRH